MDWPDFVSKRLQGVSLDQTCGASCKCLRVFIVSEHFEVLFHACLYFKFSGKQDIIL